MEPEFLPSESESTAASALILLLCSKISESSIRFLTSSYCGEGSITERKKNNSEDGSDGFSTPSDSKSCSSSLTSECCYSSDESRPHRLRILAFAAHIHDMNFKVVRRHRSKQYQISDRRKNIWTKPVVLHQVPAPVKQTRGVASSISSESSSSSTTTTAVVGNEEMSSSHRLNMRSALGTVRKWEMQRRLRNTRIRSGRMRRRAEAILKLLSVGCASEVKIRLVLGDSPDTSKALRILLKLEEVKRSGAGGAKDPFLYKAITSKNVTEGSGSDADSA